MSQKTCVCPNKFLKDFFPECKKIEDFLLIMYKFSQLFTVFGDKWRHFLESKNL